MNFEDWAKLSYGDLWFFRDYSVIDLQEAWNFAQRGIIKNKNQSMEDVT